MLLHRYAIFADAGYVYAAGGDLVHDDHSRANISVDAARLLEILRERAEERHGAGDFLRMYWYDATPMGIPQSDQLQVNAVAGVKLRLGRLTRNGQKGVDALIFRDMARLASEHAISTAFLFSGDEDLRQAVEEAQDYGIKVILIGIEPTLGANQSDILIREADDHELLGYADLQDCIRRRHIYSFGNDGYEEQPREEHPREEQPREEVQVIAPAALEPPPLVATEPQPEPKPGPMPLHQIVAAAIQAHAGAVQPSQSEVPEEPSARPFVNAPPPPFEPQSIPADPQASKHYQVGYGFGEELLTTQPQSEIRYLHSDYPRIPREFDSEILRRLVDADGLPLFTRVEEGVRYEARKGFWAALGLGERIEPAPALRDTYDIHAANPYDFGIAFAEEWKKRTAPQEVEQARVLLIRNIGLPSHVDGQMLRVSTQQFGDPVPVQVKHELRRGFKDGVLA